MYFTGGGTYSACPLEIGGTQDDIIYCSERYFNGQAPYQYNVPIPRSGFYQVKLHFAEVLYSQLANRVFDVLIDGVLEFDDLDIYKEAGLSQALVLDVIQEYSGSVITIGLEAVIENPKISGIEVIELPDYTAPTATPTVSPAPTAAPEDVALINCGGGGKSRIVPLCYRLLLLGVSHIFHQITLRFPESGHGPPTTISLVEARMPMVRMIFLIQSTIQSIRQKGTVNSRMRYVSVLPFLVCLTSF